jgi:hypothetical protein
MTDRTKSWWNRPFTLLDTSWNRWVLIISTGLFVILFMNLYTPFNVLSWYRDSPLPATVILSGFGVIGMATLIFSQFFLRWVFGVRRFRHLTYLCWFTGELLFLSLLMMLIFGDKDQIGWGLLNEYFQAFRYTLLVVVIPFALVFFYLYQTSSREAQKSKSKAAITDHLVKIKDENGILRMAIEFEDLLYIQSTDNYVTVIYMHEGQLKKELIRTSLKRLEDELNPLVFQRCHRSFMVNMKNVRVKQKNKKNLLLEIKGFPSEKIQVSKNYRSKILGIIESA